MQETIQYDACDENNWSNQGVVNTVGGTAYTAASACGQLGQSYQARDRAEIARRDRAPRSAFVISTNDARASNAQDYKCSDVIDPTTGATVPAAEMQCEVDPNMVIVARTHAKWYGAPPPLFCAPKSIVPEAPRWDITGWCPSTGTSWNQARRW